MVNRPVRYPSSLGNAAIFAVLALLMTSCDTTIETPIAKSEERESAISELPKLDRESGRGLEIWCRLVKKQFNVGEPINIWCTVANTKNETKPLGWHSNAGNYFCLVASGVTTRTGILPSAFPQLDKAVMIRSQESKPGYVLFIPPLESITVLLTYNATQPEEFSGSVVYDPVAPRGGFAYADAEDAGPPWRDEWVYSNAIEYTVVAGGES